MNWSDSYLSSPAGNFLYFQKFSFRFYTSCFYEKILIRSVFSLFDTILFMKKTFEFTRRRTRSRALCLACQKLLLFFCEKILVIFIALILFSTLHIFSLLFPFLKNSIVIKKEEKKRKKVILKIKERTGKLSIRLINFFRFQICEHRAAHSQVADCQPRRNCLPCYENSKEIRYRILACFFVIPS